MSLEKVLVPSKVLMKLEDFQNWKNPVSAHVEVKTPKSRRNRVEYPANATLKSFHDKYVEAMPIPIKTLENEDSEYGTVNKILLNGQIIDIERYGEIFDYKDTRTVMEEQLRQRDVRQVRALFAHKRQEAQDAHPEIPIAVNSVVPSFEMGGSKYAIKGEFLPPPQIVNVDNFEIVLDPIENDPDTKSHGIVSWFKKIFGKFFDKTRSRQVKQVNQKQRAFILQQF